MLCLKSLIMRFAYNLYIPPLAIASYITNDILTKLIQRSNSSTSPLPDTLTT